MQAILQASTQGFKPRQDLYFCDQSNHTLGNSTSEWFVPRSEPPQLVESTERHFGNGNSKWPISTQGRQIQEDQPINFGSGSEVLKFSTESDVLENADILLSLAAQSLNVNQTSCPSSIQNQQQSNFDPFSLIPTTLSHPLLQSLALPTPMEPNHSCVWSDNQLKDLMSMEGCNEFQLMLGLSPSAASMEPAIMDVIPNSVGDNSLSTSASSFDYSKVPKLKLSTFGLNDLQEEEDELSPLPPPAMPVMQGNCNHTLSDTQDKDVNASNSVFQFRVDDYSKETHCMEIPATQENFQNSNPYPFLSQSPSIPPMSSPIPTPTYHMDSLTFPPSQLISNIQPSPVGTLGLNLHQLDLSSPASDVCTPLGTTINPSIVDLNPQPAQTTLNHTIPALLSTSPIISPSTSPYLSPMMIANSPSLSVASATSTASGSTLSAVSLDNLSVIQNILNSSPTLTPAEEIDKVLGASITENDFTEFTDNSSDTANASLNPTFDGLLNLESDQPDRVGAMKNPKRFHNARTVRKVGGNARKQPRSYRCPYEGCEKAFTRPFNLKSHIRVHTGERPFVCSYCGKSFSRAHDLKRHVTSLHSKVKPYNCCICGKEFARVDALNRHLRVDEVCSQQHAKGCPLEKKGLQHGRRSSYISNSHYFSNDEIDGTENDYHLNSNSLSPILTASPGPSRASIDSTRSQRRRHHTYSGSTYTHRDYHEDHNPSRNSDEFDIRPNDGVELFGCTYDSNDLELISKLLESGSGSEFENVGENTKRYKLRKRNRDIGRPSYLDLLETD